MDAKSVPELNIFNFFNRLVKKTSIFLRLKFGRFKPFKKIWNFKNKFMKIRTSNVRK